MNRRAFVPALAASVAVPRLWRTARPQPRDFAPLLANAHVPSFAMVTVGTGRPTYHHAGVLRRGESALVDQDTVYQGASLTKPLFAAAFLMLVRDRMVDLDRPVGQYVALPNPGDPRAASITARHLLSHSSGWRNWRNQAADTLTCDFDPGTRWQYSGEGYYCLQRIMEQVTGEPMAMTLRRRLLDPLGMSRTSVVGLEALDAHLATGHTNDGEPRQPFGRPTLLALRERLRERGASLEQATEADVVAAMRAAEPSRPPLPNFMAPNAASSLLTTTADLGRFLSYLLGPGRDLTRQLLTPQVTRNRALQWGLGLGIEHVDGRPVGWQWGDNPGFKNFLAIDPGGDTALAILTNGDRGTRVYERVVRAITGVDHPAFLFV